MAPHRPLESTADLLALVRRGDVSARDRLLARIYKPLLRIAHGNIPMRARDLVDTEDLVQVAMLRALDHLEGFESRRQGSLLAYLHQIVKNLAKDEGRRISRKPEHQEADESLQAGGPTPLDEVAGSQAVARYEAALERLPRRQREAVVLRIELRLTYSEIAEELGLVSTNSTRMLVTRGISRVAALMRDTG